MSTPIVYSLDIVDCGTCGCAICREYAALHPDRDAYMCRGCLAKYSPEPTEIEISFRTGTITNSGVWVTEDALEKT